MKNKIILSLGFIIVSVAYALWQNLSGGQVPETAVTPTTSPNTSTPVATDTPGVVPTQKPSGLYRDGSYTGNAVDAYYGIVQVKANVSGGKLSSVQFLQHPSGHEESDHINARAMPKLIKEALVAQSAQVNGVSGATFTSKAFKESLASALASAQI